MKGKYLLFVSCAWLYLFNSVTTSAQESQVKLKAYSTAKQVRDLMGNPILPQDSVSSLATFTYTVTSSRDGNTYTGMMVGQDPFGTNFAQVTVTTPIVPLMITVNSVATGENSWPVCPHAGVGLLPNGSSILFPRVIPSGDRP